jgi:hypothetical protein
MDASSTPRFMLESRESSLERKASIFGNGGLFLFFGGASCDERQAEKLLPIFFHFFLDPRIAGFVGILSG